MSFNQFTKNTVENFRKIFFIIISYISNDLKMFNDKMVRIFEGTYIKYNLPKSLKVNRDYKVFVAVNRNKIAIHLRI